MEGFEEEEPEMTEIITLGPGEEPPAEEPEKAEGGGGDEGKVTLTKDEYEALKSGKDPTNALAKGLEDLKEVLSKQGQPANIQQQPGESDEDFEKRLESELFSEGQSGKAIREAVERYSGSQANQLMAYISQQNKRLLQLDSEKGPVFKRFQSEIEREVENLPKNQQNHPQVWDYAFEQVKGRHQDELAAESAEEKANRLFKEKMEALGLDENGNPLEGQASQRSKQRRPAHVESGKGSANRTSSSGPRKKKLYVTEQDKQEAARSGVPVEVYVKRKKG
jgi:hypothetical protein